MRSRRPETAPPVAPLALPRDAVPPDYGGDGLYGLIRSITAYLDGQPWAAPGSSSLSPGAPPRNDPRRSLAFILIDGLGDDFLQRFGQGSFLLAHRRGRLTSVFPSTTASAVTTTLTGLTPAEHGLTGWFIRDPRFGGVLAPLPMTRRDSQPLGGLLLLPRLFPYRTLFQHRRRASIFILPDYLANSPFSARHARGARVVAYDRLDGMIAAVAAAVGTLESVGGYVHAYYPVFDALSHTHGCTSERVQAQFRRIDAALAELHTRLDGSGCDLVVSADHGFTDSPPERRVCLDDHPQVAALLAAPLFGERRAAFAQVRAGAEHEFESAASELLAGRGVVVRARELLDSGLLGPGKPHRRLPERVGSHALLMEAGWTVVDHVAGEREHEMLGVHGGLSPDEMWIPLIVAPG